MATTRAGLEDVIAANSAISDIIGAQGKLTYRGIDIHDLARHSSFEETTYLLWFGSLPTRDALHQFSAELASHRALPTQVLTLMKDFPRTATPMDALRTALLLRSPGARRIPRGERRQGHAGDRANGDDRRRLRADPAGPPGGRAGTGRKPR
jgi:citrate synthase